MEKGRFVLYDSHICKCMCVSIQDLRIKWNTLCTYSTLHKTLNLKNIQIYNIMANVDLFSSVVRL